MNNIKQHLIHAVPCSITALSTIAAFGALYGVYQTHSRAYILLLIVSGAMDAFDGFVARRLGVVSRFGNIYDSLSDFFAFGVVPALFMMSLDLINPIVAIIYMLAIQFRLTRFSAMPNNAPPQKFFQGVSAPDCPYLAILIGLFPRIPYDVGFLVMSIMAVYPWKFLPKGYKPIKFAVACITAVLFVFVEGR